MNRGDYSAYDILKDCFESGSAVDGVYIRCADDLAGVYKFFKENSAVNGFTVILAASVYAYNSFATSFYDELFKDTGAALYLEESYELTPSQIDAIMYPEGVKLIKRVYGRLPLMVTDALSSEEESLKDEKGAVYPVSFSCLSDYNVIYSSTSNRIKEGGSGIRKIDFTVESGEETEEILCRI